MRAYRRSRTLRLTIAQALVEAGRLGAWDESNLAAIDAAILELAADWAENFDYVNSNGADPITRRMVAGESEEG
jgi:hypothetical protein